ncbi:hypothetical protein Q75_07585 [Bacillus coahuilensis p1.1.43]|uniref:DUF2188 domain-containing protein n=1 Tax=Bacillus coahuilensis p1.1.43 TaxID=1150625 RepID=A0A147K864_9BACI|nr:DUF2188 domain-containing protein [Bacillus coahuilensis]KUP06396.1 hypothetical protein Q75_07585 [Bacillus coahuilensis p1.1.43]
MKEYSVVPNENDNGWIVKLEDVSPIYSSITREEAIEEAKRVASVNTPSKIIIFTHNHEMDDEIKFNS